MNIILNYSTSTEREMAIDIIYRFCAAGVSFTMIDVGCSQIKITLHGC